MELHIDDITDHDFSTLTFNEEEYLKGIVIEIEDYYGNTKDAYLINCSCIVEVFPHGEGQSLYNYGVDFCFDNTRVQIVYPKAELCLADINDDYLFQTDYALIRLQAVNKEGEED